MFSIRFNDGPHQLSYDRFLPGKIIADNLNEGFRSAIGYWSADDYRRQWVAAIDVIIACGEKTALITSIEEPRASSVLDWWPIFREGQMIYIRSQLLILAQLTKPFDSSRIEDLVEPRKIFSEDGSRISEWSFNLSDLVEFRKNM